MMHSHTPRTHVLRAIALTAAFASPLLLSACETDHSAARTADFTRLTGELESYEQATLDETWQATLTAMERLAFIITQRDRSDVEARILARTQGGREVRIRLYKETTMISKVSIRIDTLGDEALSRVILSQIESNLPRKQKATSTPPPTP